MSKTHAPGSVREILAIAVPMIVSYGCDTVMMFCDRLLLSKLGPDQMNAAVAGGIAAFMMASFGFGLLGYGTALVAQHLGADHKDRCPVVTTQSWIVALVIYPCVLLLRGPAHALFGYLGVPASQIGPQIEYFDIMTYGAVLVFARHALASYFSGIGRTRVVMRASIVTMCVNIPLSYILIYGKLGSPALGIRGAAYGTLLASVVGIGILLSEYFGRANRREFAVGRSLILHPEVLGKLLRYGAPSGCEMLLTLLAANAFVLAFHSLGPVVATASSILMNWDMSAYIPLMGMEVGVTSLVGRYMGARDPDTAHRAVMSGLKVGFVYAGILLILFGVLAGPMVDLFRPGGGVDPVYDAARPMAVTMLRMISFYMFSIALVIVFVGALRGAGDTLWAMSYHISLHWLAAGVLYAGTRWLDLSALHAWALVIVVFMLFSAGAWLRYRAGGWRRLHIVD
ncbi:MAG: Multidrug resistance protein NorM [Candidatus Omnitrophica bacterium]|nr:Multidrug resistance protein NorM [Candidatus Omnitrophota bacterium]